MKNPTKSFDPHLGGVLALLVAAVLWGLPVSAADTVIFAGRLAPNGEVIDTIANAGEVATVEFFYVDPTSNIQGVTLALCFDDRLIGIDGSFDIADTFLPSLGVEFISQSVDNDTSDGDGSELLVAILLDVFPPFDNQTLPATLQPLKLGSFDYQVPADAECLSFFPIEFCDDINAGGTIPLSNAVVIANESVSPGALQSTNIFIPADVAFVRGEVNNDSETNVGDVVAILAYLFNDGATPPCLDAADLDDNGVVTLTDSLFLALFIFFDGLPPRAPFPDCGLEPSPDLDSLGCEDPVAGCPICP